jgi:hypothetical protein
MPTIAPVLIALILFGVAVIGVAAVALLRSSRATEARDTRNLDPERVEREVYEKLYGKRPGTESAPLPAKPPLKDPRPRTQRRSRPRDSDR